MQCFQTITISALQNMYGVTMHCHPVIVIHTHTVLENTKEFVS